MVFGSLAREEARDRNDLDLAALADSPLSSAEVVKPTEAAAEAVGRPVDLVDLSRADEPLLGEILRHGRRILEQDPEARAELLRRHLYEATDFLPYRRRGQEECRRAWLER